MAIRDLVKAVLHYSRCTKRQVMRVKKFYVAKPHILYIIRKILLSGVDWCQNWAKWSYLAGVMARQSFANWRSKMRFAVMFRA